MYIERYNGKKNRIVLFIEILSSFNCIIDAFTQKSKLSDFYVVRVSMFLLFPVSCTETAKCM